LVEDGGSGEVEEGAWRWDSYRGRGANAGNFPARRKLADYPFPTAIRTKLSQPHGGKKRPKCWVAACGVEQRDGICRQE
jgi:hypothetical protein